MIPKVIHYCWFGNSKKPLCIQRCIDSWNKYCPDFKVIEWNESNFDVNYNYWTSEAYGERKYAFVSDYARLKILYEHGGIYLDTDVELIKSLDSFIQNKGFIGFENSDYLQTGVIGVLPGNKVINTLLDYYRDRHFINKNGEFDQIPNVRIMTNYFKQIGLNIVDKKQIIDEFTVYPRTYFCPIDADGNRCFSKNTHAVHHFASSWRSEKEQKQVQFMHKWYYLYYLVTLNFLIKIIKLVLGSKNTKKIHNLITKQN